MNQSADYHDQLYRKWLAGTATPEEQHTLLQLINSGHGEKELAASMQEVWNGLEAGSHPAPAYAEQRISNLLAKFPATKAPVKKLFTPVRWAAAAAVILLVTATWFLLRQTVDKAPITAGTRQQIPPGRNGAVLLLADGSEVLLDTVKGVISLQGGARARLVNGALIYETTGSDTGYHTMYTPKGRQFQVTLPDGTQVWLNSASTIRYPAAFKTAQREVEISGEAYLEVSADKTKPFILQINHQATVNVLGTSLNVKSYDNESTIQTTLISGAIQVVSAQQKTLLQPGQQAEITNHKPGNIAVREGADLEQVLAWKNGVFNFNNSSVEELMRQLERWYDIEVVYEKGIPAIRLFGGAKKDISLEGMMKGLEAMGLHLRLEQGRRVVVLP